MSVGRLEQAADALEMAAEINPRHYASLAELYERMGNWEGAAQAYSSAVQSSRNPTRDLRLRMIGALLNVGSAEAAQTAREGLKDLIAASPQDTRLLYLLANANRQLGEYAAAEDAARKMLSIDATSVSALYALSQVFFAQQEPKKVVDLLGPFAKEAAARGKGNENDAALVMAQLGFAHLQLGDANAAVTAFTTAKDFAPKNPAYDAYLIQALLNGKQHARAADLAAAALSRHPGDSRLTILRADALSELGRRDEAVKILRDALAATPEDDDVTLKLGAVYEEGGRIEDAEKQFRQIIERDPLNAQALNYLGYMLADRGMRLPEAITLIERALKIDPDNPAYLDSLGWALFKQGRSEEAEAPLRKAAGVLHSESVIQDHFGDVLAQRGKNDEAIVAWERALKGDGVGIERAVLEKKIREARNRRR
jgi:tetratricopeptide (TPR) repeat protein